MLKKSIKCGKIYKRISTCNLINFGEVKTIREIICILVCILMATTYGITVLADWNPGDGHKMHFPQLPDENGWDVCATYIAEEQWGIALADDWKCSESGPVTDIHFWGSWKNGFEGTITSFWIAIHEDIPKNPPNIPYSRPGKTLWEREFRTWKIVAKDSPAQGWYCVETGEYIPNDHNRYFQYNIVNISDPFVQKEGTIYWLSISAQVKKAEPGTTQPLWGWKSSADHWNDDAVWAHWFELDWVDLYEPPYFEKSLDLAFVITGEKEEAVPDLDCDGRLRWSDIKPGSTVTGTIYVQNIGDPGSKLDWEICDYPTWGVWTFSPMSGLDLTPADGAKTITVTVTAPNQQNQQFTGKVKICNKEDATDYCTIDVSLATPKSISLNSYIIKPILSTKKISTDIITTNLLVEKFREYFPYYHIIQLLLRNY